MNAPIPGFATPETTAEYFAKKHLPPAVMPCKLGRTGLSVSPVGFGSYRVDREHPEHRIALEQALQSGCNLIDTSANYTDGSSETQIGETIAELIAKGKLRRDQVVLVTKAGYVQGMNMAIAKKRQLDDKPFPEMVKYTDDCWHCIHPQFLEDQISRSLKRLNVECLDVLLLHNPEYFLSTGGSHLDYYDRIRRAFEHLEKEVKRGRIKWYGISSNTFVAERESPEFTSLEIVLEEMEKVDPDGGRFAVIQFPMNLFELGAAYENSNTGRTTLEVALLNRIGTLVNRPLNAYLRGDRLVRLANFPGAGDPEKSVSRLQVAFEQMLDFERKFPPEIAGFSRELAWGHVLHKNFAQIQSLDRWKGVLEYQIRPTLMDVLPKLARDPARKEWLADYNKCSDELFQSITSALESQAAELSNHLAGIIDRASPALKTTKSFARKAVRVYRSIPGISCVLVGMRRPEYVTDMMELEPAVTPEEAMNALDAIRDDLSDGATSES